MDYAMLLSAVLIRTPGRRITLDRSDFLEVGASLGLQLVVEENDRNRTIDVFLQDDPANATSVDVGEVVLTPTLTIAHERTKP